MKNIVYYGKIKFFDYKTNHFGFIYDVRNSKEKLDKDVYVKECDLINTPNSYKKNLLVEFFIVERHGKYSAFNVKLVLPQEDVFLEVIQLYDKQEQVNFLEEFLKHKNYNIEESYKTKILDILKNANFPKAINILYEFAPTNFYEKLRNNIALFDNTVLYYLSKNKTDKYLFKMIAENWKFSKSDSYTKDFIGELVKQDVFLSDIPSFTDKLFISVEYLEWYIEELKNLPQNNDKKKRKLEELKIVFESKLMNMNNCLKLLYMKKIDETTMYEEILNSYNFEENNNFVEQKILIYDLIEIFENINFTEFNIEIFKKNLFDNFARFTFEQKLKWIFILNDPDLLLLFINNFDFNSEKKFYKTVDFFSANKNQFKLLCKNLKGNKIEFWKFIIYQKQNISAKILSDIIASLPNSVQFYLLRFILKLKYEGILSDLQVKEILNTINFSDLNSKLFLIFLKNGNSSLKSLKPEISNCFKESLYNQDNSELYIKNLVKTCNGRAKPQGNIHYVESKKTYSFNGAFYISKDFKENIFCEGKFWKDTTFFNEEKKQFTHKEYPIYWCRGEVCYKPNLSIDLDMPFYEWSLLEMLSIYNLPIEQTKISFLAGWANRTNEILLRLICRGCNTNLIPIPHETKKLGYYAVPLFYCLNSKCTEYKKKIRLTHCINKNCGGKNNRIIDSRDCPQCSNGWLVCQDCFACCPSHHKQKIISCPKCGTEMIYDIYNSIYKCNTCKKILNKQDTKMIENFWERKIDYKDKFVNQNKEYF